MVSEELALTKRPRSGPYICGIDAALDIVSGKWKGLVLWELHAHGTRRFAELRRALPGVSEKMLTQHLREMESDGLVHREVYAEVPPKVEYSLTDAGASLNTALRPLGQWGQDRLKRENLETSTLSPPASTTSGPARARRPGRTSAAPCPTSST
jgi:DNA-binding HxlR family transcriptional regulator